MEGGEVDLSSNLMDIPFDATAHSDLPAAAADLSAHSSATSAVKIAPDADPLNPTLFAKTKAQFLRNEAAKIGWLSKEGHIVKSWRRRYFILWPRAGSAWVAQHARSVKLAAPVSRQLLLYYESEHASAPRGVIALQRGEFQLGSEHGTAYRGEDTLVLTVHASDRTKRKRFILRSDVPGDPTELIEWARLIEAVSSPKLTVGFSQSSYIVMTVPCCWHQGTLGAPPEQPTETVQLEQPVVFVVHCPSRQKAPGVTDMVLWRRSPFMDDTAELNVDGADIFEGIADGSQVRGIAESADWLQAENGYWLPKLLLRPAHHAALGALSAAPALPAMPEGVPPEQHSTASGSAAAGMNGEHAPAAFSLDDATVPSPDTATSCSHLYDAFAIIP